MDLTDFITARVEGELLDDIKINSGPYNKALMDNLTELSVADNWEDAKKEWRVTDNAWYIRLGTQPVILPEVHRNKHPHKCVCGHDIAWHFEIENTENGTLEILGSEHITNWMIIRHLKEVKGIPEDAITEDKIQEWIKEAVKSMKAAWWWRTNGEDWEEMFNHVKELDIRINVRSKGKYYDPKTRRYEPHYVIAKTKGRSLGKMASVVWRWNHPDNNKRQINTRGYPNESLWKDVRLLYARYERMNAQLDEMDVEYQKRVKEMDEIRKVEAERVELRKQANKIREETRKEYEQEELQKACAYYDIPSFTLDQAKNDWEKRFLNDMRNKIIRRVELTTNQLNALLKIIDPQNAVEQPATYKQKKYIIKLGGEVPDGLTKTEASKMIGELR